MRREAGKESAAPLAVAALEDKIVQRATLAVLNAIYEAEARIEAARILARIIAQAIETAERMETTDE